MLLVKYHCQEKLLIIAPKTASTCKFYVLQEIYLQSKINLISSTSNDCLCYALINTSSLKPSFITNSATQGKCVKEKIAAVFPSKQKTA